MNLSWVDAGIVVVYLVAVLLVGVYMERRAGKDIQSYFLGGGTLPWWMLGMSGSSTYFDITGTMWMVSVFYVLGIRGMWEQWFWAFPFAGFAMAYKGKWAYRSGVLTGMEWLVFRYGTGRQGQSARLTMVLINLLIMVFMLGYAGIGVGIFLEEFLPFGRNTMVVGLFAITGLYVLLGGFFSVVWSDFFQTILLSVAAVYISVTAFLQIDPATFRTDVGDQWFQLAPVWRLDPTPEKYPDPFGLLVLLWVTKGVITLFQAPGGGADFQRFRAAKNEADASKVGFAWGMVITVRWALVMSFTAYGLAILSETGNAVDSEAVLPMVLNRVLPVGIKGMVIAGLIAAFMSTFDSTLNVAASFVTNDLVKPIWKSATQKQLMLVSYLSTALLVMLGIAISFKTESIASIWNPINFALGSAAIVPFLLSAYWWRINGWSFCVSAAITLPIAFYIKVFTDLRELQYFPILFGSSLVATMIASVWLPSTSKESLIEFYDKVRPFGFWTPVRKWIEESGGNPARPKQDRGDLPIALLGTFFFVVLYLLMMDLVIHNWGRVWVLAALTLISGLGLYFFWWRRLAISDNASGK
ncbi:MAG: hypothetical protein KC944_10000, partial [Candidatus Omnitrophica bacterium]|nr:hypothetical protein [Candidatus Omnitrophota bacterium]